jgi:hypothetical protein
MAHRRLLTDEERHGLFGIHSTKMGWRGASRSPALIRTWSCGGAGTPIGSGLPFSSRCCAIPGLPWRSWSSLEPLVQWLAGQLEIPAAPFAAYARRPQTMTNHARLLAMTLGLRAAANTDLPMMIEAAAEAAWSTDRGQPIAGAVVSALRAAVSCRAALSLNVPRLPVEPALDGVQRTPSCRSPTSRGPNLRACLPSTRRST